MSVHGVLRSAALVAGSAILVVAAVAPATAQSEGVITVAAKDYHFENLPTSVPAGTALGLTNEGTEFHELALARVNDDVTESVQELLALPEEEVFTKITLFGPLFANAGTTAEGTLTLEQEGRYVAICMIPQGTAGTIELPDMSASPDPNAGPPEGLGDGPPHAFLGMLQEFTVTAAGSTPGPLPSAPASQGPTEARVIDLELTDALQIVQDGQQVTEIPVTVGETITFRLTNTAGFAHNLYIGTPEELSVLAATTPVGVPDFIEGTQEFTWTVPENVAELEFACTFPGHYTLMRGTFVTA